ncbi:hypothetical protein D3C81_1232310 [compost metagenome]
MLARLLASRDLVLAAVHLQQLVRDGRELLAVGIDAIAATDDRGHVAVIGMLLQLGELLVECPGVLVLRWQMELCPLLIGEVLLWHELAGSVLVRGHRRAFRRRLVLVQRVPAPIVQVVFPGVLEISDGFEQQDCTRHGRGHGIVHAAILRSRRASRDLRPIRALKPSSMTKAPAAQGVARADHLTRCQFTRGSPAGTSPGWCPSPP